MSEQKENGNENPAPRSRSRQNSLRDYRPYVLLGVAVIAVAAVILAAGFGKRDRGEPSQEAEVLAQGDVSESTEEETIDPEAIRRSLEVENQQQSEEESRRQEEESRQQEEEDKQAVVDSYANLGLVQIDAGYLNVRRTAAADGDIIGKMQSNSACEILGQEGDWYQIRSGKVEGYISAQYVLTGEEARSRALEQVALRAEVMVEDNESLNIRSAPEMDPANIVGQAVAGDRYLVQEQLDGWIRIDGGYISADYADVKLSLNEARKMDLKAMAISKYNNLLISKVTNYLNVRSSPADEGNANIIGKLPGKAAADILGEENGWYQIRSGNISGYVSADPQYVATGQEAYDLAMEAASLMAIVNTDRLNVRMEPNTDSGIWTQISKEERYPVVAQLDGWVQIELDTGDEEGGGDAAYVSTMDNYVDVRYALSEAIKFSPLEELANQQAAQRAKIVNYALQFVGNPYVWGGTSLTRGADCSGFVQSVLKNFGISVPRVSRDQARAGKAVTSSEMRPGDLVFYTNSSGTVNHVAMYIGNGQVVHASSARTGIKISTWNYRTPYRIRNVID